MSDILLQTSFGEIGDYESNLEVMALSDSERTPSHRIFNQIKHGYESTKWARASDVFLCRSASSTRAMPTESMSVKIAVSRQWPI